MGLAAGLMILPGTASACCGFELVGPIVSAAVNSSSALVLEQLKAMAGEEKGDASKQDALVKSLAQTRMDYTASGVTAAASAHVADEVGYRAPGQEPGGQIIARQAPMVCTTMAQGKAVSEYSQAADRIRARMMSSATANGMGFQTARPNGVAQPSAAGLQGALDAASAAVTGGGDAAPGAPRSPTRAAQETFAVHVSRYCNTQDVALGLCPAASALPDGDLRADVLLSPPNGAETYAPEELDAALSFVGLLANPLPPPSLPTSQANTPQGRAYYTAQLIAQARMSVAQAALFDVVSRHTARADVGMGAQVPADQQASASPAGAAGGTTTSSVVGVVRQGLITAVRTTVSVLAAVL